MEDDAAWRADVERERAWREALYTGPDTPLAAEARARFRGLRWFPIDPAFRVRGLRLARHPEPRPAALAATGEDAAVFVEVGHLAFGLAGTPCRLTVFEPAPGEVEETYLFVPFQDATSGSETYGAGRYLDFEPRDDDAYELDFNRAYHPYCAFDDAWACTLPPPENRLAVKVQAGERL